MWVRLSHLAICTLSLLAAYFVALSAISFPSILLLPSIHLMKILSLFALAILRFCKLASLILGLLYYHKFVDY